MSLAATPRIALDKTPCNIGKAEEQPCNVTDDNLKADVSTHEIALAFSPLPLILTHNFVLISVMNPCTLSKKSALPRVGFASRQTSGPR
jgi:hypothetical protein